MFFFYHSGTQLVYITINLLIALVYEFKKNYNNIGIKFVIYIMKLWHNYGDRICETLYIRYILFQYIDKDKIDLQKINNY